MPRPPVPVVGLGLGTWRREPGTVLRRAVSVPPGDSPYAIIIESELPATPTEWPPHSHPAHELVWVRGGTMIARVGRQIFTVPAGSGLWLPAGVMHGGRLTAKVSFYDAFFAPDRTPIAFDGPTAITITALLESLLLRLARPELDPAARARTEAVVFDVLEPSPQPLTLPLPGEPRIDAIVGALLHNPGDNRGLQEWASLLGCSERTVTRAFRTTTGLSFLQWRQALRVHEALALLSEGVGVTATAARLGYATPSAFIAAFRKVLNVTPGALAPPTRTRVPADHGENRAIEDQLTHFSP